MNPSIKNGRLTHPSFTEAVSFKKIKTLHFLLISQEREQALFISERVNRRQNVLIKIRV